MRLLMTCTLLAFVISSMAMAEECRPIEFELDASDIRTLSLDTGAGDLYLTGGVEDDLVVVQARACADDRDTLEDMDVLYERRRDTWNVETRIEDTWSLFGGSANARIDMEVTVPDGLVLLIDDGSGPIEIRQMVGDVTIDDGSGAVEVQDLTGPLVIEDGSGSIYLADIHGPVRVDDGSGSLDIRRSREVEIRDGSGSIVIRDIEGDVDILDDGSGSLRIERVTGHVAIHDDGSGSITVRDVRGGLTALDTGSGSVRYGDIDGDIRVKD